MTDKNCSEIDKVYSYYYNLFGGSDSKYVSNPFLDLSAGISVLAGLTDSTDNMDRHLLNNLFYA